MVLLEFSLADGTRKKCDARCYNDHRKDCECICGGANHGKGIEVAIANTSENWAKLRGNWNRRKGSSFATVSYLSTSQVLPFESDPTSEQPSGGSHHAT